MEIIDYLVKKTMRTFLLAGFILNSAYSPFTSSKNQGFGSKSQAKEKVSRAKLTFLSFPTTALEAPI